MDYWRYHPMDTKLQTRYSTTMLALNNGTVSETSKLERLNVGTKEFHCRVRHRSYCDLTLALKNFTVECDIEVTATYMSKEIKYIISINYT